jgi:AraC family transcriptional activator FtrA
VARRPRPPAKRRSPPRVVALAYDRMGTFELGVVAEIFGLERPEMGPSWYRFGVAGVEPGPLAGTGGLRFVVDSGLELLERATTIVAPGWRRGDRPPPALALALRRAHARGARLVSICSGAFLLAATGLLDGRRATTHWRYVDELERAHPRVDVVRDVLYVDDHGLFTSAGSAAGIDLCLHLVRLDFGAEAANTVARRLVVPAHRDGSQLQYLERPVPRDHEVGRLSRLLDRMRARLAQRMTIAALAAEAVMSERTFIRRFKEATGIAPGAWLIRERVGRARELLETTPAAIDAIAESCGFGTAAALRHQFHRHVGVPPTTYRARFATRT